MKVTKENIAAEIVTITPEEQQAIEQKLIDYRVSIGLLKSLRDSGKLSSASHRKGVREIGKKMGFDKNSIFAEIAC